MTATEAESAWIAPAFGASKYSCCSETGHVTLHVGALDKNFYGDEIKILLAFGGPEREYRAQGGLQFLGLCGERRRGTASFSAIIVDP